MPSPCFTGAQAGGYAKKHNPFAYYTRHRALAVALPAADRLRRSWRATCATGRLPTFAWISPNLCDDGHDCGVRAADGFLARTVPALLRALGPHGFLVLQWDEGTSDARLLRRARRAGTSRRSSPARRCAAARASAAPIDQYGVLGSIEQALGLPALGGAADPRSGRLAPLFAQRAARCAERRAHGARRALATRRAATRDLRARART